MTALALIGAVPIALVILLAWPISGCLFDLLQARRKHKGKSNGSSTYPHTVAHPGVNPRPASEAEEKAEAQE